MRKRTIGRLAGFVGAVGVTAALVAATAGSTGAYFSDSRSGTITGTTGSIHVTGNGGNGTDNLDFQFTNMLPGNLSTANAGYSNTGSSTQDVWLVFNKDDLSALNSLGTYGEMHVSSNGTEIFASQNLNDNTVSCPPGSTSVEHPIPCNALPQEIKLASNVAPHANGNFSLSFGFSAKLSGKTAEDQPMTFAPGVSQLRYQVVATQQGITPDNALNTPGNLGH